MNHIKLYLDKAYMSRLAKKPIVVPDKVSCSVTDEAIVVTGPKGELHIANNPLVNVAVTDTEVVLTVSDTEDQEQKAHWGLVASLIRNMIVGVTEGYEKKLEINGVGYRAAMKGSDLELVVGYSHPVLYKPQDGVTLEVEKNVITVTGIDKQKVGQAAAEIRQVRKPEPYKGKGIKYSDEVIRRKAGKVGKAAA